MLPQAGEPAMTSAHTSARYRVGQTRPGSPAAIPDMQGWLRFARTAEQAGIESVLISISRHEPDPMLIACALGRATERLKYIVAYRSGLLLPTTFVQQLNTLSSLLDGRVAFNIVAGSSTAEQHAYGDSVAHDERYARADEFLAICDQLWQPSARVDFEGRHYRIVDGWFPTPFVNDRRVGPEIYVSGHSEQAERLAMRRGSCWLRVAEPPDQLAPLVERARAQGIEVGLRLCVLCRPTRAEAVELVESLIPHCTIGMWSEDGDTRNDSRMYAEAASRPAWLSDNLWAGLVPACGPVWTTLLGSPNEIADALLEYKRIGVTQFIFSSWPETAEVERFGREVVPLVRDRENL
jgi:alkanesulfonate monooxygenase